jgi:hypothetical protein
VGDAVARLGNADATARAHAVRHATVGAFHAGCLAAVALTLVALAATLLIRDEDAAATMARPTVKVPAKLAEAPTGAD